MKFVIYHEASYNNFINEFILAADKIGIFWTTLKLGKDCFLVFKTKTYCNEFLDILQNCSSSHRVWRIKTAKIGTK